MTPVLAFPALLALNVLWFGAGAWYFGLAPRAAARLLVPRSARGSPLADTVAASVRFLGGLNFAFAVLAGLVLAHRALFPSPGQHALLAAVFAIAHATQFGANVPVALAGGRRREALWPVLSGPMLGIFVVDAGLALANAAFALGAG